MLPDFHLVQVEPVGIKEMSFFHRGQPHGMDANGEYAGAFPSFSRSLDQYRIAPGACQVVEGRESRRPVYAFFATIRPSSSGSTGS